MKKMLKIVERISKTLKESDEAEDSINALTMCLACAISTLPLKEQKDCMVQTIIFLQKMVGEVELKKRTVKWKS